MRARGGIRAAASMVTRPLGRGARALRERRHRIAAAVILVGLVVSAVGLLGLRADTTPSSFLPPDDPSVQQLDAAAASFGGDPIVVLIESPEPRALFAPGEVEKLIALEGRLALLRDAAVVYGPGSAVNQIAGSAQNLLASLSGTRDATRAAAEERVRASGGSPEDAQAAAVEATAAFDARYAALMVRALPAGLPTVRNPAFVNAVVFDASGAPASQMRFVVPNESAVAILIRPRQGLDQAGVVDLVDQARRTVESGDFEGHRVTVTGTPAIAAELGATTAREIPVIGGLAVALIAVCYLATPWVRNRRHRLLPIAATLGAITVVLAAFGWIGRPISIGVIAFLPILVGIGSDFPAYVVHGVQRRIVVVTALASAAGFASLALSPLPFVRDLGLALAAGILAALVIALGLRRWLIDPARRVDGDAGTGTAESASGSAPVSVPARPMWQRAGALVCAVAVAGAGWFALPHLEIAARPDQLAAGLPAIQDARHAEETLGSSGEVAVVLRGDDVSTPEALAWMREVEQTTVLESGDRLRPIVSLPSLVRFLGPDPTAEEIQAALELLPSYLSDAVLRPDMREAVLSFGVGLQDIKDQKALLEGLEARLPAVPPGTEASVAGLPVAAARGYTLVSEDRWVANLGGIVAAGLVLLVGLRRRRDAGLAVLAAALATGWGLALTWLLGVPLSPLTIALGSLTSVTACEFTLMLRHGGSRHRWTRRTVVVAAAAAALGYLALVASELAVIRDFGMLLSLAVLLSLAAASLIVWMLPARVAAVPPTPTPISRPALEEVAR